MEVAGSKRLVVMLFSDTMGCGPDLVYEGYWLVCEGKYRCA